MSDTMFFELAKLMREAQKAYFRERTPEALERSKALERQLDAAIKERSDPQPRFPFPRD